MREPSKNGFFADNIDLGDADFASLPDFTGDDLADIFAAESTQTEEHTNETKFTYISPFSSSNGKAVFFRLWIFVMPTNNAAFHPENILHFIEPVPYTPVCQFQIISNCLHRDRG